MQKFLASILLLVYFAVSSGFTVNLHYCMDRMASLTLGASKGESCTKCGMTKEDNHGCCRDEVKVVKLQQDTAPAFFAIFHFPAGFALTESFIFPLLHHPAAPAEPNSQAHAPPLLSKLPTYISNCVFRL